MTILAWVYIWGRSSITIILKKVSLGIILGEIRYAWLLCMYACVPCVCWGWRRLPINFVCNSFGIVTDVHRRCDKANSSRDVRQLHRHIKIYLCGFYNDNPVNNFTKRVSCLIVSSSSRTFLSQGSRSNSVTIFTRHLSLSHTVHSRVIKMLVFLHHSCIGVCESVYVCLTHLLVVCVCIFFSFSLSLTEPWINKSCWECLSGRIC